MKKIVRTSLLILALSCSAYAGYIPNNVTGTPASQPNGVQTSMQELTIRDVQGQSATGHTMTEIALNLLQSMLTLV